MANGMTVFAAQEKSAEMFGGFVKNAYLCKQRIIYKR